MDHIRGAGASRAGEDLHNEDSYLVRDGLGLYVVCDGLGSAPGGEVAAHLATEAITHYLDQVDETQAIRTGTVSVQTIDDALRYALGCILDARETRPDLAAMDSTITLLLIQGRRGFIGHVGDSRAYLVRGRDSVQLTRDQEWTESEPMLQSTSGDSTPAIEIFGLSLEVGDTILLCTDGAEREIEAMHRQHSIHDLSPRLLASRIVSAAHRRDPDNDSTVVVVRVRDEPDAVWLELSGPAERYRETHTILPRSARPAAARKALDASSDADSKPGSGDRKRKPAS